MQWLQCSQATLKISLPSFQVRVKEGEAKFQVDILCDENSSCSVSLERQDWYELTSPCVPDTLKEIKKFCVCYNLTPATSP